MREPLVFLFRLALLGILALTYTYISTIDKTYRSLFYYK